MSRQQAEGEQGASPQELFAEAVALHQQGRLQEAEGRYLQVLEVFPGHPKILGNLAALYQQCGRLAEAAECCRVALVEAPGDALLHLNLGAIREEEGDIPAAEACYRRAMELDPGDPKALSNMGKILQRQGRGEEGEKYVRWALQLAPDYPLALNNLGVICSGQGRYEEALACFRRALELEPQSVNALYNIAGVHNCLDQREEAVIRLRQLLEVRPDHAPARHMLAALSGQTTDIAPRDYVVETFDSYAERFDRHLTGQLGYAVPTVLREMVSAALGEGERLERMIDLGCGTGLAGEAFRGIAGELHGIDISAGMLAKAAAKHIYERLECADIVSWLECCNGCYDLIVAADVFVYIGRLDQVFAALERCAAPGALFALSIEHCDTGADYILRPSGRFAHSPAYIERLAGGHGWSVAERRHQGTRREQGKWIEGDLFLLRR
jgi:predicted TPR repeat methyltransferase